MKIVYLFSIFGFTSALPVIYHNSNSEGSGSFQNSAVNRKNTFNPSQRLLQTDHSKSQSYDYDRIYFPDEPAIYSYNNFEVVREGESTDEPSQRSRVRFRHSLPEASESQESDSSTDISKLMFGEQLEEDRLDLETSQVPLSFLEEWAKQNSKVSHSSEDVTIVPEAMSTELLGHVPIVPGGETQNSNNTGHQSALDKNALSFQSLFQLPIFAQRKKRVDDCPLNERRNHHGKCVRRIRIIVVEDEENSGS